jgi:crossover junction endodeoxyribonuclease RusA
LCSDRGQDLVVIIIVNGMPAPQGNHRVNRSGAVYETSKAVGPWREAVRAETQRAMLMLSGAFTGPVKVTLKFVVPRPKGHYRTGRNAGMLRDAAPSWPAGKPDVDKLARAVLDGLTAGGAWKDDSQVVQLFAGKSYAAQDSPGCVITVHDLEAEEM